MKGKGRSKTSLGVVDWKLASPLPCHGGTQTSAVYKPEEGSPELKRAGTPLSGFQPAELGEITSYCL